MRAADSISERKGTGLGNGYFVTWVTTYTDTADEVDPDQVRIVDGAVDGEFLLAEGLGHFAEADLIGEVRLAGRCQRMLEAMVAHRLECGEAGGRDAVTLHELLGEDLGALELGRLAIGAKGIDAIVA